MNAFERQLLEDYYEEELSILELAARAYAVYGMETCCRRQDYWEEYDETDDIDLLKQIYYQVMMSGFLLLTVKERNAPGQSNK